MLKYQSYVVIFLLVSSFCCTEESPICVFIVHAEKNDTYPESCHVNKICNKTFHVASVNLPPHSLEGEPSVVCSIVVKYGGQERMPLHIPKHNIQNVVTQGAYTTSPFHTN